MTLTVTDLESFSRLGIPPNLLTAAGVERVTDIEARERFGIQFRGDKSGIVFPYYNQIGQRVTARERRDHPEVDADGKPLNKYVAPYGDNRHCYFPPGFFAALTEEPGKTIVIVEAEKSALAGTAWAQRRGAPFLFMAVGGCWGWRGKIGRTEGTRGGWTEVKGPLPDLFHCDGRAVSILFDANVRVNPSVQAAERALAAELRKRNCRVTVGRIPGNDGVNGPDDYIGAVGDDAMARILEEAKEADTGCGDAARDVIAVQQIFTERHGEELRYTAESGRWHRWNGQRYEPMMPCDVIELSRLVCRELSLLPENARDRPWIASPTTIAGVERLARGRVEHRIGLAEWDADPWLLNTPGGMVDLRTGEMRAARAEDLCTKVTAVAPAGPYRAGMCPLWLKFLDRVTQGDRELEAFLQRMAGYCLTGITREHALFFFYGPGGNGKGTFMNATSGAMGDYAQTAAMAVLMGSETDRHPTELAALQGARMVLMSEPEEGGRWAEAKVKTLTGGDKISARFMRQDFFEYRPQFKPVIAGNHKPGLKSPDAAMRRRMHLILFTAEISAGERDTQLGEKLQAEWPGILSWMIAGCLEWQRIGLCPPRSVTSATEEYLASEDRIGRWTEERCLPDRTNWIAVQELYGNYTHWSDECGERPGSLQKFSMSLEGRGFAKERKGYIRGFEGLRLRV